MMATGYRANKAKNGTIITYYAPVIIPTLNRYKDFISCLESLEKCTGAIYTDVYIGIDYPPTDKYVDGWNKICRYLDQKKEVHGFNNLIIIKRNFNFGIKGDQNNIKQLIKHVLDSGKYDRYILTEDDNIFSPNFLEFINKGLELYKNDKRIYSICGYKNNFECKHNENNHFAQHSLHQGWGYGTWMDRHIESYNTLTPHYFKRILYSPKKLYRCFKYWPHWTGALYAAAMTTRNYITPYDVYLGFYLITENKVVICPTISKVKNMGFNELANTTSLNHENLRGRAIHENNLRIDTENTFNFIGNPYQYEDENSYNVARWDGQWENPSIKKSLKIYLKIWFFRILNLIGVV